MNEQDKQVLIHQRKIANIFAKRGGDINKISASRLQQTSKLNYCRFLATRSFNCFRENYEFTTGAVADLQSLLNAQFDKIPYGWEVYQIDAGIARIIEAFIKDRKIQRRSVDHISI